GLFGTAKDFLDAVYQYPGGYISDRIGTRRALVLFSSLAGFGYLAYAFAPKWYYVFAGLALVMAWSSMASPAIFALIAEHLPPNRRAMGFTVQSILKRVPAMAAPVLGGILITRAGLVHGIRLALFITAGLALLTIVIQLTFYISSEHKRPDFSIGLKKQFRTMHPSLKRLLLSDILVRTCEGMVNVFIVLYAMNVTGVTAVEFGYLMAVQMGTSIAVYLPAARLSDRFGRKPFVVATFICFALFPIAIILARGFLTLMLAFVVGGLRETGEPSRKAMIVDLADPGRRGRTVGLYYLTRSLSITPAALVGGFLWKVNPDVPFLVACAIGLAGAAVFAATVEASPDGKQAPRL
ncbi:MAG TPA: MFS transporter, partial [Blastocatellia bacterium]|nr:MFS transporter [Blastocatellia bacterium]